MARDWNSTRTERGSPLGLLFAWMDNGWGVSGLLAGGLLWLLSAGSLALAMRANLAASARQHELAFSGTEVLIRHLHGAAVFWTLGFTTLQILSFLLFAFVLRGGYRLRSAVCFAIGAGFVIFGDVLGLFGLLVWVGMTLNQA